MECERSDLAHPLRQGDILAAQPGTTEWANPWTRFAVVITADCDLAQRKTGPSLVYLPIIGHYTFLADVRLPTEAEKLAGRGRDSIAKKLTVYDAKLAFRHIASWGEAGGENNIARRLDDHLATRTDNADPKKTASIIAIWKAVVAFDRLSQLPNPTQTEKLPDLLSEFFGHRAVVDTEFNGSAEDRRRAIEGALSATQERADTWLIRELIGLDPEMVQEGNFGFVVLLRSYSLLGMDRIETDRGQWYKSTEKYLRICRLRGLYKSDLVQQFANLFC
jgi:hypothetical protein